MNKLIAEAVATFTLVFVGVAAIAAPGSLVGIALAHGIAIAVMVAATAGISGGHVNPAVSIAMWISRRMDGKEALGYVAAQCLGALAGMAAAGMAVPADRLAAVSHGTPLPAAGIEPGMALAMEVFLTFFLMSVILGAAVDRRAPKPGALFIGLAVAMGILAGGPVSGAAMNPARHLGPAILGGHLDGLWIYWVGPVAGAALAAWVHTLTHGSE